MSSELTDKTHVLVTRLGDFWVNHERGNSIMQIISRDPRAQIEFDGSYVTAQNVEGLLTAGQYHDLQCKRRGMWQCKYQQWHGRNDQCYCAQNAQRSRTQYEPVDDERPPMTDEQKAAAKERLDTMRRKFFNRGGKRKIQ